MIGLGIFDFICKDQYDSDTGETYKALTCCNDEDMAIRCKVKDAQKVVWSVKANSNFNNEICVLLRNGIQNGKIDFLISDQDCEEDLVKTFGNRIYSKFSASDQIALKMPYLQTTLAEYELIKLDHEIKNGNIKVKEQSGMRKDRYSSIAYNFWCASQLELKLRPNKADTNFMDMFKFRPAKKVTRF